MYWFKTDHSILFFTISEGPSYEFVRRSNVLRFSPTEKRNQESQRTLRRFNRPRGRRGQNVVLHGTPTFTLDPIVSSFRLQQTQKLLKYLVGTGGTYTESIREETQLWQRRSPQDTIRQFGSGVPTWTGDPNDIPSLLNFVPFLKIPDPYIKLATLYGIFIFLNQDSNSNGTLSYLPRSDVTCPGLSHVPVPVLVHSPLSHPYSSTSVVLPWKQSNGLKSDLGIPPYPSLRWVLPLSPTFHSNLCPRVLRLFLRVLPLKLFNVTLSNPLVTIDIVIKVFCGLLR